MAYELSGYQIALISVLLVNFVFWILIIICKSFLAENIANAFRRYVYGLRDLLRPQNSTVSQTERSRESTLERRQSQIINHEPPPPYEEAVKYPSISSLLSSSALESANFHAGICNDGLVRDSIVITINGDDGVVDYGSQRVLDPVDRSLFAEQISCPTTSQVTLSPPLPRSLSCNDLLNLPPLPFNEKAQFTISSSPFTKREVASPTNTSSNISATSGNINSSVIVANKGTNCKLKSKLPREVNFTLKVNTNQPCTSSGGAIEAPNVTGISETICLQESHRSLSKNTSIIDDDDVPSSTIACTVAHVETSTSVLGNTSDRQ